MPVPSPPLPRPGRSAPRRSRVLLLVESHAGYGRAILEGVIQHAEHHAEWEFMHELWPRVGPELIEHYPDADGIIAEATRPGMLAALQEVVVPVVLVTGQPQSVGLPLVIADNVAVGRSAFEYFHDLGYRHVGYYGYHGVWHSGVRERAFLAAAEAAGCDHYLRHTTLRQGEHQGRAHEEAALAEWIGDLPKPVAILAAHDPLGRIVASACRMAKVFVPEEVAILGVDNDELECNLAAPPLSSIDHGTHRIGYEAAALLARRMAGEPPPAEPSVVEPIGVVVRQSTSTLAIDDRHVAAAVRYIREHASDGIKIEDVLARVPASRRTLEVNFRRILGRTMHQEILRTRVERARQLLIQTDWAMPEISVHCGFNYASHFSRLFKSVTGLTPQAYRRRFRTG